MYLLLLPNDVFNELLFYTPLKDCKNLFSACGIKPSIEQLRLLAEWNELPYAHSIDILIAYSDYTKEECIKYCIKLNDYESFVRLYESSYEQLVDRFLMFDSGFLRPEIANYYITQTPGDENLNIAIKHKVWDQVAILTKKYGSFVGVYLPDVGGDALMKMFHVVSKPLQEQILGAALLVCDYKLAIKFIDLGVTEINEYYPNENCPVELLYKLTPRRRMSQLSFIELAYKRKDNELLKVLIQRYGLPDDEKITTYIIRNKIITITELCEYSRTDKKFFDLYKTCIAVVAKTPCWKDETELWRAIKRRDYTTAGEYIKKGASGKRVQWIYKDIPDDVLQGLVSVRSSGALMQVSELALERGFEDLIVSLVEHESNLLWCRNSLKGVLSILLKKERITQKGADAILRYRCG